MRDIDILAALLELPCTGLKTSDEQTINFADDLAIGNDGSIFFSNASTRHNYAPGVKIVDDLARDTIASHAVQPNASIRSSDSF